MHLPEQVRPFLAGRQRAALLWSLPLLVLLPLFLPTRASRASAHYVVSGICTAILLVTVWRAQRNGWATRTGWWFMLLGALPLSLHAGRLLSAEPSYAKVDAAFGLRLVAILAFAAAAMSWQRAASGTALLLTVDAWILAVAVATIFWITAILRETAELAATQVWLLALMTAAACGAIASLLVLVIRRARRPHNLGLILVGVAIMCGASVITLAGSLQTLFRFGANGNLVELMGYVLIATAAATATAETEMQTEPEPEARSGRFESRWQFALVLVAMATAPIGDSMLQLATKRGLAEGVRGPAGWVVTAASTIVLTLVASRMLLMQRSGTRTRHQLLHASQATEGTQDAIVMIDLNNRITDVNAGFADLYGWAREEIIEHDIRLLYGADAQVVSWERVYAAVGEYGSWAGQVQLPDKRGRSIPIQMSFSGVHDEEGRVIGYTQVHHDLRPELERARIEARLDEEREAHALAQAVAAGGLPLQDTLDGAVRALITLPGIASALVCAMGDSEYEVLAVAGPMVGVVHAGDVLACELGQAVAAAIAVRSAVVPWTGGPAGAGPDAWQWFPEASRGGEPGVVAFAPIRVGQVLVAAIGVVGRGPDGGGVLSVLDAFAGTLAVRVGPAIARALSRKQRVRAMTDMIAGGEFHTVFQPICDLATGVPVGYEALTRFPAAAPDVMFAQASELGVGLDLEVATVNRALELAQGLPSGCYLSINASPELVGSRFLCARLAGMQRDMVVELTEHDAVSHYGDMRALLDELRSLARIAVDDTGSGYSSLQHLVELAPDVIKIDIALVRNIDSDAAKQAMVDAVTSFAERTGASVVAEGIETEAQRHTLRTLGLHLGQGYLLGRPAPLTA